MASRRNLKKNIAYIADLITGYCIIASTETTEEKRAELADLICGINAARADMLSRISHTEAGNVKGFYKKLKTDFDTQTADAFRKLEEILK